MAVARRVWEFLRSAAGMRWVQGSLTVTWFLLIAPSVLWWRYFVPWLVIMSAWANFAGHWAA